MLLLVQIPHLPPPNSPPPPIKPSEVALAEVKKEACRDGNRSWKRTRNNRGRYGKFDKSRTGKRERQKHGRATTSIVYAIRLNVISGSSGHYGQAKLSWKIFQIIIKSQSSLERLYGSPLNSLQTDPVNSGHRRRLSVHPFDLPLKTCGIDKGFLLVIWWLIIYRWWDGDSDSDSRKRRWMLGKKSRTSQHIFLWWWTRWYSSGTLFSCRLKSNHNKSFINQLVEIFIITDHIFIRILHFFFFYYDDKQKLEFVVNNSPVVRMSLTRTLTSDDDDDGDQNRNCYCAT